MSTVSISNLRRASACAYTNNLTSNPGGNTMHRQLDIKILNALRAAVGSIDPPALCVFVGGRRRNRRRWKKNDQNKRKQKKSENQNNAQKGKLSKDHLERKEEKDHLNKTDYNGNISCSIGSQIVHSLTQTTIEADDINTNNENPEKVVISQPKTTWENKLDNERNENSINNAQLLDDIDIEELLSDDLIIASKLTNAGVIMAAIDDIKLGGLQLIPLDDDIDEDENSDYDDFDDVEDNNNVPSLKQELEDAINAYNIYGRGEFDNTTEPEVSDTEVEIETVGGDLEPGELAIASQPQIQDEVIVKPEKVPLIERACPISDQRLEVSCCVIS